MSKSQEHNSANSRSVSEVRGGCHCGAVRFIALVPKDSTVLACNCSVCKMTGFNHLITPKEAFTLINGEALLTSYKFNTALANHLFCSVCGIKSFYQPRSHPDSWSINTRCIDDFDISKWRIEKFDGQNWEQAKRDLEHLGCFKVPIHDSADQQSISGTTTRAGQFFRWFYTFVSAATYLWLWREG